MNMIRHDAPSQQVVAISVEVFQGIDNEIRDFRMFQPVRTVDLLECGFHYLVINLLKSLASIGR